MNAKLATYQGRSVRILKIKTYGHYTSARIRSLGEPFYTEYAGRDDRSYWRYERTIWVNLAQLENVHIGQIPADSQNHQNDQVDEKGVHDGRG